MSTASTDRKLLRLVTRLNVGGPARHVLLLTRDLPGWDTTLAAGRPAADEGELRDPAVPVTDVPLVRPLRPAVDVTALGAVRRLITTERPALVHTHMAKAGTIGRLAALSVRDRPATVHTFHGHVLDGYFRPAVQRAFVEAERLLARRTDRLVAVSEEIRDQLLELRIGRSEQYRVVRLGLELDAHRAITAPAGVLREAIGVDADTLLVGVVGRLVPIKNLELLFRAFSRVPDAHLAVLGDGELRDQHEARVRELGLAERVHFLGWWTDVPTAMSDLDVVVLTSRNEGTPVSLIEAAACARPVVATDVGGVRSVVRDGEDGLLVPADDETALVDALTRLLGDDDLRRRLGAAGRAGAGRFDAARLVRDITELYDELVPDR